MEYFIPTFKHGFCSINEKWLPHGDTSLEFARKSEGLPQGLEGTDLGVCMTGLRLSLKADREVLKKFGHGLRRESWRKQMMWARQQLLLDSTWWSHHLQGIEDLEKGKARDPGWRGLQHMNVDHARRSLHLDSLREQRKMWAWTGRLKRWEGALTGYKRGPAALKENIQNPPRKPRLARVRVIVWVKTGGEKKGQNLEERQTWV